MCARDIRRCEFTLNLNCVVVTVPSRSQLSYHALQGDDEKKSAGNQIDESKERAEIEARVSTSDGRVLVPGRGVLLILRSPDATLYSHLQLKLNGYQAHQSAHTTGTYTFDE